MRLQLTSLSTGIIMLWFGGFITLQAQVPSLDWANGLLCAYSEGGEAEGKSIALDAQGNIYVLGYFSGTIDFDPDPNKKQYLSSKGGDDIFLVKYNAENQCVWALSMGGEGMDQGMALAIDNAGFIYITGFFSAKASFNPLADSLLSAIPKTSTLTSAGGEDIFVACYNSKGEYKGVIGMGGAGNDRAIGIAAHGSSDVYITGSFEGTANFNPEGKAELISKGEADIFVAKFTAATYVWAFGMGSEANDYGNAIALDGVGNVYLAGKLRGTADFNPQGGAKLTSQGASDMFLAKYTFNGDYVWANRMGGSGEDEATALTVDIRGYIYATGSFSKTARFNPSSDVALTSAGKRDAFLAKYNTNGGYLWANRMGGIDDDFGTGLEIVGKNNVVVTGCFVGIADFSAEQANSKIRSDGEVHDIFFAKYNTDGGFVWVNRVGGKYSEYANALALDAKGNVYMTGCFEGTADFDPGEKTVKLNTNAIQTLFVAQYDAETAAYKQAFAVGYRYDASLSKIKSIAIDKAQNILIAGYFEGAVNFNPQGTSILTSSGRWSDIFIAKYDSNGTFLWVKQMGEEYKDVCNGMDLDAQGNIFITGYFEGSSYFGNVGQHRLASAGDKDIFLAKYNPHGELVWVRQFGGSGDDQGLDVKVDVGGNPIVVGSFEGKVNFNPFANEVLDADKSLFVAKYSSEGHLVWVNKPEGRNGLDRGASLALDLAGNAYLTGFFEGVASFERSNSTTLKSAGGDDAFLAKYSNMGQLLWVKRMGGNKNDRGTDVAVSDDGNVYVTGRFSGNAAFGSNTHSAIGAEDAFLVKYSKNGDFLWAKTFGGNSHDEGMGLTITKQGQIYLTGYFQGTANFDASGEHGLTSMSLIGSDIFLAKYDSEGQCQWARGFGSVATDMGTGLVLNAAGAIIMSAAFQGIVDFDPSGGVKELNNTAIPSSAALIKYLDFEYAHISYITFDANRPNSDQVILTWTSSSERNNAGFEVERKLEGANDFSRVGYIIGFGDTDEPTNYRFTDLNAFDGLSYYRFRQMDFSGKGTYSKVLMVEGLLSDKMGKITLYPLPVSDELNIRFGRMPDKATSAKLSIVNSKGLIVHEFSAAVSSNELLEIDEVKDLERGRYIVKIEYSNGDFAVQEFVKE